MVEKGVYSPQQPRMGARAMDMITNKHKCREAQEPETPGDIGLRENDEADDNTDNEAGENIVRPKTGLLGFLLHFFPY